MEEKDFNIIKEDLISKIGEMKPLCCSGLGGPIMSDLSDIGNEIGFIIGEHIVSMGLDKDDFISGVKHGISLKDGTHG